MRVVPLLLLVGCVMDRTGQSATDRMRRELADHDHRVADLEKGSTDVGRRLGQVEEVTRSLGQDQMNRLDTLDQIRTELASLRGQIEVLQHDYQSTKDGANGFQMDADARISYLEARVANLESKLGIKPPPKDGQAVVDPVTPPVPPPAPLPATPDEVFTLIAKNLQDGDEAAARAVAQRFITENPKSDRLSEAYYRVAESYQNEQNYKDAAAAFQVVVDKFKDSTWAPYAMLRQGECFASLGRKDAAEVFWGDVIRLYPKSKASKEAKAHLAGK